MSAPDFDVFGAPLSGVTLIEASAGTGKTWNLSGLYLRLLLERDVAVQQLLVVTFTNAATAELRHRIRSRLAEVRRWLDHPGDDPFAQGIVAAALASGRTRDALCARLDAALATFDEAAIFTIHGFCQRALGQIPFAAGLPFRLELVPDDSDLRLQVAADFWRREVGGAELPEPLAAALLRHRDSPERWAELLGARLKRPLARTIWEVPAAAAAAVVTDADTADTDAVPAQAGAAGTAAAADAPVAVPTLAALNAAFAELAARWHADGEAAVAVLHARLEHLKNCDADKLAACARAWRAFAGGCDPLGGRDEIARLRWLDAATHAGRMKKIGKGKAAAPAPVPEHPFFEVARAFFALREAYEADGETLRRRLLRRLHEEGCEAVGRLKREHRRVAYDDLLANVHAALVDPAYHWLGAALRERYPAALIDEFQDTDPLQYAVFDTIYRGSDAPVFMVGDPKQAIYSFRNADLHVYLRARDRADRRFTLRANQRSTGALIDACNGLFGANPALFLTERLDYEPVLVGAKPRAPFVDRTPSGASAAALRVQWLAADAHGQLPMRPDALDRATQATAAEIARLLTAAAHGQITVDGKPLKASSVAVLVRSHAQGRRVRAELARLGIGSVELSQESVFASIDAEELERLLHAVIEPGRTGTLLAALGTGMLGRDAAELAAIGQDESRLLDLIERFGGWRALWIARGFGTMLRQLMRDEDIAARLLRREDGERRLTNLLHLAELAQAAAVTHPAPDSLLRWLATQRAEAAGGEEAQLRLESDDQLVQIVTIHKSKGLEYDIVFCPFLWDSPGGRGEGGESVGYHDANGDWVLDFTPEARADDTIKTRRSHEQRAEMLRLYYVALTRAVHRCYVVAGCCLKRTGKGTSDSASRRSLLNWIVAGTGHEAGKWFDSRYRSLPASTDIEAAWQSLAAGLDGRLSIDPLAEVTGEAARLPRPPAALLAALPAPARLPRGWRPGSFSGLVHGAQAQDAAAPDHDARVALVAEGTTASEAVAEATRIGPVAASAAPTHAAAAGQRKAAGTGIVRRGAPVQRDLFADDLADDVADAALDDVDEAADRGLAATAAGGPGDGAAVDPSTDALDPARAFLGFPRGPSAGDCLHSMLERIDFGAGPDDWRPAAEGSLREHPQRLPNLAHDVAQARLADMLVQAAHDATRARLPVGFTLAQVDARRRLPELAFWLPARGLTAPALNAFLQSRGYRVPRLGFGPLDGYLNGFIDLVFEHRGRWYVLDWKSNHLGERATDYDDAPLADAMAEHGYALQALLYLLALHRWLSRRVPGYRWDRHMGGALYLFVRGMPSGWSHPDGRARGVWHHLPDLAVIEALGRLVDETRSEAGR